jgi:hypothetical protein
MKVIDQHITDRVAIYNADVVQGIQGIADNSVGYSVFSPPFASLFCYTALPNDFGNCGSHGEFYKHFKFLTGELFRVLKPGRLLSFHCCDIPTTKGKDGFIGFTDFSGDLIALFRDAGFVQHSPRITIWKNPVTEMQRTKALGLLHKQVKKDSCMSRVGNPDFIITMRKPGINADPVSGRFDHYIGTDGPEPLREGLKVTGRNEAEADKERFSIEVWQRYASPVWMDIDQTDTLNYQAARDDNDVRHICPLQLGVIHRCIQLWSNPGDVILTPFLGIGSELYEAVKMGRKGVGFELKESYYREAVRNLTAAEQSLGERDLFSDIPDESTEVEA